MDDSRVRDTSEDDLYLTIQSMTCPTSMIDADILQIDDSDIIVLHIDIMVDVDLGSSDPFKDPIV